MKVEQFAVGFGQALLSWRKGLGFRWGSTSAEYLQKLETYLEERHLEPRSTSAPRPANEPELSGISTFGDLPTGSETAPTDGHTAAQLSRASAALGISETEYRLNWIPLGGYVKMLGQDDMKPGVSVNDPRSYNNKTIAQRMVIVSAGVVMNVILAAIGFMAIFTIGYEVPKPVVGAVVPGSPAQQTFKMVGDKIELAPLQVGDRILELNGRTQSDFDKIKLNTALLIAGERVPLVVQRADGSTDALTIIPAKADPDSEFPAIGVAEGLTLKGPPKDEKIESSGQQLPELLLLKDGDVITQVNGSPVQPDQYPALYAAIQAAAGKPVDVTIRNADGSTRTASLQPHFMDRFGGAPINFAGLEMLTQIDSVEAASPAKDLLQPGDVITGVTGLAAGSRPHLFPTRKELIEQISGAGAAGAQLKMDLLRGGKPISVQVDPKLKIAPGRYGLGIGLDMDEHDLIVADTLDASPARAANVPRGAMLQGINGNPGAQLVRGEQCRRRPHARPAPVSLRRGERQAGDVRAGRALAGADRLRPPEPVGNLLRRTAAAGHLRARGPAHLGRRPMGHRRNPRRHPGRSTKPSARW